MGVNHQFEPAFEFMQKEADADGKLLPYDLHRALLEAARRAAKPSVLEDKAH